MNIAYVETFESVNLEGLRDKINQFLADEKYSNIYDVADIKYNVVDVDGVAVSYIAMILCTIKENK